MNIEHLKKILHFIRNDLCQTILVVGVTIMIVMNLLDNSNNVSFLEAILHILRFPR